ncbi:glycogen synthase [Shouchella shacheensis]|uniref:glycogen synthase n=1 Tax=Shouchella shacheensis TaxID=1649580 RepID=UPI00073FF59C|nr:glycogen synthase [Shouchella shacheensis]
MKKILFVASECSPFVKTGGLADVIGSLPLALKQSNGADVRVILPLYDEVAESYSEEFQYVARFHVTLGWREQEVSLYSYEYKGVIYYFIENNYYFTRKGIYGYYDDGERFVFFSHAVMAALAKLDFVPDVLHAHDWQAGLVVALANIEQPIEGLKTVFTIHNIKYQGVMPHSTFSDFFNLSGEHFSGFEWNGMINCMKSALFHADKITTVSPSYAEEILDPYYSEGLHPLLHERLEDLSGILNGIDTKEYNPLTDPNLHITYRDSRVKKSINKAFLQEKLGLSVDESIPLYIMVTRLTEQKGLHLIKRILPEFLQHNVQFILLGTGEAEFEAFFAELPHIFPDQVRSLLSFNEELARQMYASADFFLMPSQFEPCGLAQLIALQYKTVPIVRETGGLRDTVVPFNSVSGEGNGFSFANYNAHDLLHVLYDSLDVYQDAIQWRRLIKNVNKQKFDWQHSAEEYSQLYATVTK